MLAIGVADSSLVASKPELVRSVSSDQKEILSWVYRLHLEPRGLPWFECDVTYGNGLFWRGGLEPILKFDLDPQAEDVVEACSMALPLADGAVGSVVFDPPFLTYIRAGRAGNGKMVMSGRFAGYWTYKELELHYRGSIAEAARVLRKEGVLVVKCQDIIHNHKMHCTHANVIAWSAEAGLRLLDLFVMPASHRMPSPNRAGTQKHARIFHSYFLVFCRV